MNQSVFSTQISFYSHFVYAMVAVVEDFAITYVYTIYIPGAHGGNRRVSDPMGLELWITVNCNVSARNQTRVL